MEKIHPDDIEEAKSIKTNFIENKTSIESQVRINCKDNYKWFKTTRFTKNDYYILSIQNIDNIKRLELSLTLEKEKLEGIFNQKSILLANTNHELRTALNGIIGMITLLENTHMTEEQTEYMTMIQDCSYNLISIINDVLDFSKLEVGKISLVNTEFDFRECIDSTNNIIIS
jgi:signal transduction histidine kinase